MNYARTHILYWNEKKQCFIFEKNKLADEYNKYIVYEGCNFYIYNLLKWYFGKDKAIYPKTKYS